jgi:DNA polymerase-3 subunit epsilon
MSTTIVVGIDVETVNRAHAICDFAAVGLDLRDGERVFTVTSLVDPGDVTWDPYVARVHGIDQRAVRGMPTFDALWAVFEDWLRCGYEMRLFAHNARFDRAAIANAVGNDRVPAFECTYELARAHLELPNHRLGTVCAALEIPLARAHRAEDDAAAAAELAWRLILGQALTPPTQRSSVPSTGHVGTASSTAPSSQPPRRRAYTTNEDRGKNREVIQSTTRVGNALSGLQVCITGEFACGMTKRDAKVLIVEQGGRPVDNVSSKCNVLVVAGQTGPLSDADLTSAKARAAQAHGVRLINETEFLALVRP